MYPEYLIKNGKYYGPWICLYKNKLLFDSINNINDYNIFIRSRPDIIFSNKINLSLLDNKKK